MCERVSPGTLLGKQFWKSEHEVNFGVLFIWAHVQVLSFNGY